MTDLGAQVKAPEIRADIVTRWRHRARWFRGLELSQSAKESGPHGTSSCNHTFVATQDATLLNYVLSAKS